MSAGFDIRWTRSRERREELGDFPDPDEVWLAPSVDYYPDTSGRLFWCNAHGRRATSVCVRIWPSKESPGRPEFHASVHCAPGLGGILIPCDVVDLTGQAEIVRK